MSAAVVSTSVMGSAAITIHRSSGLPSAISWICSRNVLAFAKISGASNLRTTRPSSVSACG